MEEKEADEMEMAAQANEEREKIKEAAQVRVKEVFLNFKLIKNTKTI